MGAAVSCLPDFDQKPKRSNSCLPDFHQKQKKPNLPPPLSEAEKGEKKAATKASAMKGLNAHGFGIAKVPTAPQDAGLWTHYQNKGPVQEKLTVQNICYRGYTHDELDFKKPIHCILVDFKADGMQMGMLIQRLVASGQQFVFVGDPLPFNDAWHFTAVNDFENEGEQKKLNPDWNNIRIWHKVNYVPVLKDGRPALVPLESFDNGGSKVDYQGADAICVGPNFKMSHIYCVGGLMAGTLIANVVRAGTPANAFIQEHIELKTTFATIGHGLGVLVGAGTREKSAFTGFSAAVLKDQVRLMKISGMTGAGELSVHEHVHNNGCKLVSASFWGKATSGDWFRKLCLESLGCEDEFRTFSMKSEEIVFKLDCPQPAKAPTKRTVAIFVDYKFDPVEAYAAVMKLEEAGVNYQFISHSTEAAEVLPNDVRPVDSELVFGNANYGLHDCYMTAQTTPADKVNKETGFAAFAIVGGQGPFQMMGDENIIGLLNTIKSQGGIGAAVCHGPMVLIGSDYITTDEPDGPTITSFNGAWIYFRDILSRYTTEKPGHCQIDSDSGLITGNSPVAALKWSEMICAELTRKRFTGSIAGPP